MAAVNVRNVSGEGETRKLIELWGEEHIQSQLKNFSIRNSTVHAKLSQKMKECGFSRTAKQIDTKLKHLKEVYSKYKDKVNRSGAGAGKPPNFFDEIDHILSTSPQTHPTFVIDSGSFTSSHSSSNSSDGCPLDEEDIESNGMFCVQ